MKQVIEIFKFTHSSSMYKLMFLLIAIMSALSQLIYIVQAFVQEQLVEILYGKEFSQYLYTLITVILIYIFLAFFHAFSYFAGEMYNRRLEFNLRKKLYAKLNHIPYKSVKQYDLELFVMNMTDDIQAVSVYTTWILVTLISTLILGIVALIYISTISPVLTLIIAILGICHNVILYLFTRKQKELEEQTRHNKLSLQSEIEYFTNTLEIWRNKSTFKWSFNRFNTIQNRQISNQISLNFYYKYAELSSQFLFGILPIALGFYVFYLIIQDKASFGVLFALQVLSVRALMPFTSIGHQMVNYKSVKIAYQKLQNLFKDDSEAIGNHTTLNTKLGEPLYELINVDYVEDEKYIIRNFSLTIYPNEKIHIKGASGAGKSTLAQLLSGLLAPTSGSILFAGRSLSTYDHSLLTYHIGYTPQQIDTLHIDVASLQKSPYYEQLCANHNINNDDGLSEGQKQILQFCELIEGKHSVLILDEWVASVDIATRKLIYNILNEYTGTVIIISHLEDELSFVTKKVEI